MLLTLSLMTMVFSDELRSYATVRQLEVMDAIEKTGSQRKAAILLNVNRGTICNAIIGVKRKAALKGYAPEHNMTRTVPEPFIVRGVSTYYNKDGKPSGQWVKSRVDDNALEQIIHDSIASLIEGVRGLSPIISTPKHNNDDLLCVYPMGDPHFGMKAWAEDAGDNFDLKIAEDLTCGAIDRLVDTAPQAKTAILLNLGDMFHADNQRNVTQSGHQLDVDGRWAKVQQVGLRSMIYCLHRLLEKHENVVFRINRGNHDGHSSYALALMLSCYFDKEPRIDIDLSPATMWYYEFGNVLIGSTHGDTIKGKDILSIMASDVPKMWGNSTHRYCYIGHVHHHDAKEYQGGIVEYFRTLAARDAWHQGQGYRAGRDMRLIVLHKQHGEIERHTCDIGMIERADNE
jgi:hypothetical protein